MADTGAPYFIPYVEPTDLVREYPAADEAQADAIAAALDGIPVLAGIGSNVVQTIKTDVFSVVSNVFEDITGLEATITPSSATAKILVVAFLSVSGTNGGWIRLSGGNATESFVGDPAGSRTQAAFGFGLTPSGGGDQSENGTVVFLDSPATTAPVTYKVQARPRNTNHTAVVGQGITDSNQGWAGRHPCSLTLIEVAA